MAIVSDAIGIAYHSHLTTVYDHYYGDKGMACKCLRILPAKIVAHYNQPGIPEQPLVLRARFKDLMFPMRDGEITSALKTDVLLAIEGRKSPKIITMTFTYCPWCGVRYTEDV